MTSATCWPDVVALSQCATERAVINVNGQAIHFVTGNHINPAMAYETAIHKHGKVATRSRNWHDFFNALVWLNWPHIKSALNALHIRAGVSSIRNRARDALTLLDESGVVVAYSEPSLWDQLRRAEWQGLFVHQRAAVRASMRFYLLGHALHEKALSPYPAMTGKCLAVAVTDDFFALNYAQQRLQLDVLLARQLAANAPQTPAQFPPLPLLGIPGISPRSEAPDFYANTAIFRPRHVT